LVVFWNPVFHRRRNILASLLVILWLQFAAVKTPWIAYR
jgi:hypothetical protein